MRERVTLIILVLIIAAIASGPRLAQGGEPERRPAPNFKCDVWLNSKPLTRSALRGRVVLVDFWEYTCINCIRTFPYLRRWNRLYAPLGLVIIGVHTPEFDFAKSPELVETAARRFGLDFPIAVDSDRTVWAAFHNYAWPADYLIDKDGNIASVHLGEGEYAEMEHQIQALLKQADPKLDFAAAKFKIPPDRPMSGGTCQMPTPELYLGAERGGHLANPGGYRPLTSAFYAPPAEIPLDRFALGGGWIAESEFIRQVAAPGGPSTASLTLHYRAKSVYLVAGAEAGTAELYVTQDGKPLARGARGVDVKTDARGATYVALGAKRMYYLVNNPAFSDHTLDLIVATTGIALYSFTFGNDCETPFDHR